jgi:hypothetical protein
MSEPDRRLPHELLMQAIPLAAEHFASTSGESSSEIVQQKHADRTKPCTLPTAGPRSRRSRR